MVDAVVKVTIEKIATGGAGLARLGGKAVFIEGTALGETVICHLAEEHRSWVRAELREIVTASPDRVEPVCGFYGRCGGCNLQHLNYASQLAAKTAIINETFMRIGGFSPPPPLIFPSNPWEYRNRMQFHPNPAGFWGLKARKKGDIIPITDCPIADPGIRALLKGEGRERLASLSAPEKDRFSVYARNGLLLSEGAVTRGKTRILNRDLTLDAGIFFQSNGALLEKLIADLQEIIRGADQTLPMADLYCGVGTFAAFLGDAFPHIDLVEEHKTALALSRENLARHISADFFAQRSEQWVKNGIPRRYGFISADPPRQGFDTTVACRLAQSGVPLLAYISCDPATLARDSALLRRGGYTLAELRYYDFYPQTAHIECLAIFVRE